MLYVCPYRQTLGFKAILFCNKSRLYDMRNSASNLNIYMINTGTKINHKILIFRTNTCISILRNMKLTNFDTERQYYTLHFDWCSI